MTDAPTTTRTTSAPTPARTDPGATVPAAALLEDALFQVKRVVVGQDRLVERVMVCLLADGHCLIEGFPGLAKTLTVSTTATVVGGSFTRLQFTPDLVPADLVGTRIWRPSTEDFDIEWGPVFSNIVLADEINRAPAKVQSALLEAMAERQVSIGGHTRELPDPFLVLATQNPIESEGVYALPEAQRDRFLMHVVVPHPTYEEETAIASRMSGSAPRGAAGPHARPAARAAGAHRGRVRAPRGPGLRRPPRHDHARPRALGPPRPRRATSPSAPARAARSASSPPPARLAVLRGRRFVVPQDVFDVAPEVLRHRVTLTYDALAEGVTHRRRAARDAQPRQRAARRLADPAGHRRRHRSS